MAFVDLARKQLVLKVVLAGPPAVGKTTRLLQIAPSTGLVEYGAQNVGVTQMAALSSARSDGQRTVVIEVYEWHGHETADVRGKALFTGLDGVIYIADAREDRYVDTKNTYEYLCKTLGRTRINRLPGLLLIGQTDEGLLRLGSFKSVFSRGPTWSQKLEISPDDSTAFRESVLLFAEAMLARNV